VTAAEPSDLAFHAAFLMSPGFAGDAEERVELVVRAQGDESPGLVPVPSFQHPDHGRPEVVIADQAGQGAEVLERQDVAFEEGFLRLGGERDVERAARVRQPHHEHPQLQQDPGDGGVELAESTPASAPGKASRLSGTVVAGRRVRDL
jgi:hypothetical protein